MIEIFISTEILSWLKDESVDDGIGFVTKESDEGMKKDGYPHIIEISEEIADHLVSTYEKELDCTFDEPCYMYNTALEILRAEEHPITIN